MSGATYEPFRVTIACGGTGGHLFPGLAVARELRNRRCAVTLLVSTKEVDQIALRGLHDFNVLALPAVGLSQRRLPGFLRGFARSYWLARRTFRLEPPDAVLAMGGFTSAPPLIAARRLGAQAFLHESNAIPGRANRWLSWIVDGAFVGFPSAALRLHTRRTTVTGTPVRPEFEPLDPARCRSALGLDPARPVVLTTGGSQGASGLNRLLLKAAPLASRDAPELQWLHLSGAADFESVKAAYADFGLRAVVFPFFHDMPLALGAATVALSRAGGSSLAELAAMRLPSVLVPFPAATEDHQWHNAKTFEESGAARIVIQSEATPERLSALLLGLVRDSSVRAALKGALGKWHKPHAAGQIAQHMLDRLTARASVDGARRSSSRPSGAPGAPDVGRGRSWLLPANSMAHHSDTREVAP